MIILQTYLLNILHQTNCMMREIILLTEIYWRDLNFAARFHMFLEKVNWQKTDCEWRKNAHQCRFYEEDEEDSTRRCTRDPASNHVILSWMYALTWPCPSAPKHAPRGGACRPGGRCTSSRCYIRRESRPQGGHTVVPRQFSIKISLFLFEAMIFKYFYVNEYIWSYWHQKKIYWTKMISRNLVRSHERPPSI